jgi:aspartate racemase
VAGCVPFAKFNYHSEMKTIGLIGGMSWESSALYYRLINEETGRRLGAHHNAPSLMITVDFAEVQRLQHEGNWDQLAKLMANAARSLELGGAEFIVLCTNTMHKLAESITRVVRIPFLHIVDATAAEIKRSRHKRVGLLATRFTMEQDFYAERMRNQFGIETIIPSSASRQMVHDVIYQELCQGVIRQESRERYQQVIMELAGMGAESIILGCTEIELLISAVHSKLPLHPSTTIHARAAVEFALHGETQTHDDADHLA